MATQALPFTPATRSNTSLTASLESRILHALAVRAPRWLTSDQLTVLALAAQIGAGAAYAAARFHPSALLLACLCIALNWLGDSLDGTLARVRNQQRPRFGFYVDHASDLLGTLALMLGLGASGLLHWPVAIAMLLGFFLLAAESFLAAHTIRHFALAQAGFGPTELRLLLIAGSLAALRSPLTHVFGHTFLLFDLGGSIGAAGMFAVALITITRHTIQLYREEPLP